MDFKKCSEVYGYKSIAEVEEEEMEAKLTERVCDFAQSLIDAGKITADEAASFSKISRDRFQERNYNSPVSTIPSRESSKLWHESWLYIYQMMLEYSSS